MIGYRKLIGLCSGQQERARALVQECGAGRCGLRHTEIADALGISDRTLRNYLNGSQSMPIAFEIALNVLALAVHEANEER